MNSLTLNARLVSAAIAAATTLGLFSTIVSIAEPQRSVLMAKNQRGQQQRAAPVEVATASNSMSHEGK
jgi:hypothetical protein